MADSPHSTAVEFISKWDYHNASREQAKVLEEQVRDFPRGAQWEPEDLIAAFSHLRDVACTRDFPVYDTAPAALTNAALDWLLKHTEDNETYYDAYLAFIVAAVAAGPKLFQIEMMNKITSRRMRECLKNISGDRLVNFLRGLKKQFENNETMPKEYCSKLSSVLRTRVLQEFTKDQINLYPGPFLELFMFYQSQVPSADEHYGQLYYTNLVNALEHIMGRDKWKELEASVPDPAPLMISEQIKAITNVVKSGKFPAYEKQPDLFKSCLRNLLQIIRANKFYFPLYLDDVMQSFCVFAKLTCDAEVHEKLLDPHSSFFNRLSEDCKVLVENKPDLFLKYAPMLTNLLLDMKNPAPLARIIKNVIEYFLTPTSGGNPGHVKLWIKFLAAMVTQPDTRYIETVERFMKNQKKLLKWKENVDGARLILANIGATKYLPKWEGKGRRDETDPERVGRAMGSVADELLKQAKFAKVVGQLQPDILDLVKQILDSGEQNTFCIAKECCDFIDVKDDLTLALPAIQAYEQAFLNEDYPWSHWALVGVSMDLLTKVIQAHKDPAQFKPYIPHYVSIFKTAMSRDYLDYESGSKNIFGYILTGPLIVLGALYRSAKDMEDMKPLLADTVRMLTCDDEDIANSISSLFMIISMGNKALFAPNLPEILQALLDNGNTSLFSVVEGAYPHNPNPVDEEFERIFDLLNTMEANSKSQVVNLLKVMAVHSPKLFTAEKVDHLFEEYLSDPMLGGMVMQLLEALSKGAPQLLEPHMNELFKHMSSMLGAAMVPQIVVNIAHNNKKLTNPVFDGLIKFVSTCTGDYSYLASPLNSIRVMGNEDRELLKPHKALFEATGQKHAQLKDMCKMLVDIIEGRSVDDITEKIDQQQEGLEQLDTRVANTENEVADLGQEVGRQGEAVNQLNQDVTEQGARLDDLGQVVDDTVIKVEEIDNKTLDNAPVWSRDISKLLNPEAEHDWRLLAQRLGYSPEDIRGWATQHDPCMSMLSEWFATHKTSEATKAVLKTLEEMNRLDAAEIVGRATKAAESVIADEPPDYETPPPVFLSYQWGHQPEARLLRKHLEMAGFESWMDIGQMGGGDKLYAKIDEGIRAAKAVICCVTEKYAKSPNCNREVNLAVNLGKPIIPILLETVTWPPPGSMGPIFGEYLYIRFFKRSPEEGTGDERVWPALSFQELLMQLSYLKLLPELSKVKPPYTNWWEPPEEVIVIKKKSAKSEGTKSASGAKEHKVEGQQPEVFISYQWGIQPDVKALYKRLCGIGFHCWMDIHQMGGGDSLYDKIDRGVRGCRVVISCVTEKYSKSANCRREVSLADALKKPIIPLLLEDTTWPPSGPMSMVFTQLLYINFKDEKARGSWSGSQFEELLTKIRSFVPDEGENTSAKTSKSQPMPTQQPSMPVSTPHNGEKEAKVIQSAPDVCSSPPSEERPKSSQRRKGRPSTPKSKSTSRSCLIL